MAKNLGQLIPNLTFENDRKMAELEVVCRRNRAQELRALIEYVRGA